MAEDLKRSIKLGSYDIIIDDEIVRDVPAKEGYVIDDTELSMYEDEYPGFIAIQYGLEHMWQLKPDKTWETIV